MKRGLTGKVIDFLASGNRPLRILLFGGIFLAWAIMKILARLFDIDTDIGDDVGLANAVIIIVSILSGFSVAYGVVAFLEKAKEQEQDEQ